MVQNVPSYQNPIIYRFFCAGLFIWFSSLTLIQIFLSQYNLMSIYVYVLLFTPTILMLLFSFVIYWKLEKIMPERNHKKINIALCIFFAYLFWGGISVLFAMVEEKYYFIGFGYLLGYIVTLSILGLAKKINITAYWNHHKIQGQHDIVSYTAFISSSFLIIFILFLSLYDGSLFSDTRNIVNLKPATIGLISLPVFIYPLVYRINIIRLILMGVASLLIILTGSRTAILSIITIIIFIFSIKRPIYLILSIVMGMCIAFFHLETIQYINDRILYLDDYYRGLSSLSGRWDLWAEFWKIFEKSPIVGYGFRMTDIFLESKEVASAHNAYLSSLVETGIVGTTFLLSAVFLTMINLAKKTIKYQNDAAFFYLSILLAALIFGMGERFIINIGNVTSILCMFAILINNDTLPLEYNCFPFIEYYAIKVSKNENNWGKGLGLTAHPLDLKEGSRRREWLIS